MSIGKLFLVPTPIGNLKDITLRALEVLKEVDIIAAEDTRQTLKLLNHFEIKKTLINYHKHNEQSKGDEIIAILKSGQNIAIVTDAGTPGISDPGAIVVSKCIEQGIEFEVLPGATAITTALVYSGLDTTKFIFRGFVPRETKERKKLISEIIEARETLIFYESPHRILSTLTFFVENFGDRRIALCRELTKFYEEIKRGTITEVIQSFEGKSIKGEFVIVLEGKSQKEIDEQIRKSNEELGIEQHIIQFIDQGMSKKEAIKEVAKLRGLAKKEVYKYSIEIK